jgi:predicted membrane metal-binding protein
VFAYDGLGPMPFLFKSYRLTRSTREVLARIRLKLVLSKQPLLFFCLGIEHPPRGLSRCPFLLCLVASLSIVFLGVVVRLLSCLSLYRGSCIEVSVERAEPVGGRTHRWNKDLEGEQLQVH